MKREYENESLIERVISWGLVVFGSLAAVGALIRIAWTDEAVLKRIDQTTLLYLAVAAALMLLQKVRSFSFGDYKLEFQELKKATDEAKRAAQIAEDVAMFGVGPSGTPTKSTLATAEVARGIALDDPWKGQFNGNEKCNGRRLRATVVELSSRPGWFLIDLVVEAISPESHPLAGEVQFFIHDTYANPRPVVPVGPDGRAQLHLSSWGAFTVGAITDNGGTSLELDLAELPDAPKLFRDR